MRILSLVMLAATASIAGVLLLVWSPGAAAFQSEATPTPAGLTEFDNPVGGIIPGPNSGTAPADAGDRGGVLQLVLLALILGFGGLAVFNIRRAGRNRPKPLSTQRASSPELADPDLDSPSG